MRRFERKQQNWAKIPQNTAKEFEAAMRETLNADSSEPNNSLTWVKF